MLRQLVGNPGKIQQQELDSQTAASTSGETSLAIKDGGQRGRSPSMSLNLHGNASPRPSISQQPRPSIVPTRGPSLIGLLATKRFVKQLGTRVARRRYGSFLGGSSRLSHSSNIQKEPSYRMTPHRKFDCKKVEECIREVLEEKLENFPYNPKFCANMCKVLSDEIKSEVKAMNFDRYKIVCTVQIGQRRDQGIYVTSLCAWDEKLDNFASYTFKNDKIFCTALVFGIYNE
ncbi:tctex1 domain-containing protein 2 [Aplysia californica]|uniref:Tctex1 domain-containing protein 2 n=1 Tax=Aplysia californica TaxID=6500 RepID=A0ABM0K2J2_APLCA|nr:tctex1 domain-containing protein 2 [Aplysia californica]